MKKAIWGILLLGCIASLTAMGCGNSAKKESTDFVAEAEKAAQRAQQEAERAAAQAQEDADNAAKQAKMEAEKAAVEKQARVEAERAAAEEQARIEAERAAEQAKAEADEKANKIKELIAQAKEYLENGEYGEAMNTAKVVLDQYDSNSDAAKDIFNTAKAEATKFAGEKAGEVTNGLKDSAGGLGF